MLWPRPSAGTPARARRSAAVRATAASGLVADHRGLGDRAAQQPGAEGAVGLAAGVGPVVGVGRRSPVFQAGGEPAAGRGELLVEPAYQEPFEGERRWSRRRPGRRARAAPRARR